MAGTIAELRRGSWQTYWDPDRHQQYAILKYCVGNYWKLGEDLTLHEDENESTPEKLVLRCSWKNNDNALKLIIPQSEGSITQAAVEKGIAHIAPFYMGPKGAMPYRGSLFLFANRE